METRKRIIDVERPNKGYYATVLSMALVLTLSSVVGMKMLNQHSSIGFSTCEVYNAETVKCTVR